MEYWITVGSGERESPGEEKVLVEQTRIDQVEVFRCEINTLIKRYL